MLIDAFDTLVFAEMFLERLQEADKRLAKKQLTEEKQWLQTAIARLAAVVTPVAGLSMKCAQLPELEEVRPDLAKSVQNAVIDAVERLQAGITFHLGPRAPVLEELFGPLKLPALRRANRDDFEKFIGWFSRRLKTGYIKRTLAGDDCVPVQGALEAVTQSFDAWSAALSPAELPETDAETLRTQLTAAAESISPVMQQARLLTEAALLPVDGLFAELGLGAKQKKRAAPKAAPEAPPPVHPDPLEAAQDKQSRGESIPETPGAEAIDAEAQLAAKPKKRAVPKAAPASPPPIGQNRGKSIPEMPVPQAINAELQAPVKKGKRVAEA